MAQQLKMITEEMNRLKAELRSEDGGIAELHRSLASLQNNPLLAGGLPPGRGGGGQSVADVMGAPSGQEGGEGRGGALRMRRGGEGGGSSRNVRFTEDTKQEMTDQRRCAPLVLSFLLL